MHVCQNLQIMIRTRGLGRALGRVIDRALGREDHHDSDDVSQCRRPTAFARRQQQAAPIAEDDPVVIEDVHAHAEKAIDDAQGFSVNIGDRGLISAFVERWHKETNSFHLPVGELIITLDDVASLLHLPITGAFHSFEPLSCISHSSKSYYACVGENTYAYQSSSKDLTSINNHLNGNRKVRGPLKFDDVDIRNGYGYGLVTCAPTRVCVPLPQFLTRFFLHTGTTQATTAPTNHRAATTFGSFFISHFLNKSNSFFFFHTAIELSSGSGRGWGYFSFFFFPLFFLGFLDSDSSRVPFAIPSPSCSEPSIFLLRA
ncbi:Retinoblastoma-related protein [Glycine max]|nr:Retinoblastoma-related protein [Glycine max]